MHGKMVYILHTVLLFSADIKYIIDSIMKIFEL